MSRLKFLIVMLTFVVVGTGGFAQARDIDKLSGFDTTPPPIVIYELVEISVPVAVMTSGEGIDKASALRNALSDAKAQAIQQALAANPGFFVVKIMPTTIRFTDTVIGANGLTQIGCYFGATITMRKLVPFTGGVSGL